VPSLPDIFWQLASERLAEHPSLLHQWSGPDSKGKRVLYIPKAEDNGFDVRIECETYGIYPYADGWHGAPWDAPNSTLDAVCKDCLGFIRSVVSPEAVLTVMYAGTKPYKWILSYPWGETRTHDETGLLFFNYFARRQKRTLQNHHLPARQVDQRAT
jgi:hypothetical protein